LALMVSFALHGIALSTQFIQINPRNFDDQTQPMEVVLVNAKTREAPLKADVLAQVNLAGGGNVDDNRQAKSSLPASKHESQANPAALQTKVQQLEQQARQLMTQLNSKAAVESVPEPTTRRQTDSSDLMQQASEAAKLQARISQQWDEYQRRPRREFVGASAKSYVFASYVEAWISKVERIGNNNYPEAARRQGIYGSLRLTVSIFADGRVEKIEIDQSSGSKLLDQAAVRIVEMGAPYAAFSREMKEKADILSITRTWTFTRSDQIVTD
jgi:protein TonB